MKQTVFYLLTGNSNLPYLVVSLKTLREHYSGDVIIHAWENSYSQCLKIAEYFNCECVRTFPQYTSKNAQELNKIKILRSDERENWEDRAVLYIDADTAVVNPLDDLFEDIEEYGFVATRFCDWSMDVSVVRNRVESLFRKSSIEKKWITAALEKTRPSYNSGVFGVSFSEDSIAGSVLKKWEEWTWDARSVFIAGETTLHPIMAMFGNSVRTVKGIYNCSAKYQKNSTIKEEDVVIWHFHGDSAVKPGKSQRAQDLWLPLYRKAREENWGHINEWIETCDSPRRCRKGSNPWELHPTQVGK